MDKSRDVTGPAVVEGTQAIAGLRQQVIANATILFPNANTHHKDKADAFEVIIARDENDGKHLYQAVLTLDAGVGGRPMIAAQSYLTNSLNAALYTLPELLAFQVKLTRGLVLQDMGEEDRMEFEGGAAFDKSLLKGNH